MADTAAEPRKKGFGKGKKGKKGEEAQETPEVQEQAQSSMPEKPKNSVPRIELSSQEKAAAVIVSLGADKASQLYKYMEPDDVEQLTIEVAKLGFLGYEQTEEVLNEFYQMCLSNKAVTEGGLEYARAVLEKAYGPQTAEELLGGMFDGFTAEEFETLNRLLRRLVANCGRMACEMEALPPQTAQAPAACPSGCAR